MNTNEPRVVVLILGYNDEENIVEAIDSVRNQTYRNFELIYIDNASRDRTLLMVRENFPSVRIIDNKSNLMYAMAYKEALNKFFNEGFEAAVLLNSDVVVDNKWLQELVKSAYKSVDIASAQPKIYLWEGDRKLANSFGNIINYLGFGFCGHYKKRDSDEFKEDREIAYASGASLFVKKEAYLKSGGLDESFSAYLEDQDLGWRMRMLGYKNILSANSFMWHKYKFQKNKRNKWKFYMLERNRLYFIVKNYSLKLIVLIFPVLIFMELGILVNSAFRGYFFDKLKGYADFARNIPMLYKKRKKIQNSRIVSDKRLIKNLSPEINFEEIESIFLDIANIILRIYFKLIKKII